MGQLHFSLRRLKCICYLLVCYLIHDVGSFTLDFWLDRLMSVILIEELNFSWCGSAYIWCYLFFQVFTFYGYWLLFGNVILVEYCIVSLQSLLLIISLLYFFKGMKAQFGMTWLMGRVFMLLNRGWSGLSIPDLSVSHCSLVTFFGRIYENNKPFDILVTHSSVCSDFNSDV